MVAKIADLGVARIVPHMRVAAIMTKAPGASVYMPPEAMEDKSEQEEDEKQEEDKEGKTSKYDASIDVFSFGVVSIFTLSQTFPCKLLAPNYREGDKYIARTELERREHYMRMIYSQLREQHPLLQMIERCLDFPENRPSIREVLHLLEQARAEDRDEETEMNKLELLSRNKSFERDLQSRVLEVTELQQQLRSSEREKQIIIQQLRRKEADLTRAEETTRIEQQQRQQKDSELAQAQQQIQEIRQQEAELLAQAQQQLREKEEQLQSSEALVADFQQKDSESLQHQVVVILELKELSAKLVREYEREMDEALKGKLPMDEKDFFRIHELKLEMKMSSLQQENRRINPLHSSSEDIQPLLNQLEQEIIIWSEPEDGSKKKVVGGIVYKFTTQNFSESKKQCENLFRDLMKASKIQDNFNEALQTSKPLDIGFEILGMSLEYLKNSIGPAAKEVLDKGRSKLYQLGEKITGKPQKVKVIGEANDKIKLSWEPPARNPEAAETYVVFKRAEGGVWEEAKRTEKTKALVTDLESNVKYEMKVMATNSTIMSLASMAEFETELLTVAVNVCITPRPMLGIALIRSPIVDMIPELRDHPNFTTFLTLLFPMIGNPLYSPATLPHCAARDLNSKPYGHMVEDTAL